MARHKDFGSGKRVDEFEPLSFTLNGQTFTCRRAISGKHLLDMAAGIDSADAGSSVRVIASFFKTAMDDQEYARFDALLKDPEIIIGSETIADILGWLVSEYSGRPTEEPAH
jgi:hypothetical protein